MRRAEPDTDQLLAAAGDGDARARGRLLERHRERLCRMVAVRLDRRLAARVDPSDVVQEALAEADRRLDEYLRDRPLPFYPWLRRLAGLKMADAYRRHLTAGRRTVSREEPGGLPDESALELADRLAGVASGPGARSVAASRTPRCGPRWIDCRSGTARCWSSDTWKTCRRPTRRRCWGAATGRSRSGCSGRYGGCGSCWTGRSHDDGIIGAFVPVP